MPRRWLTGLAALSVVFTGAMTSLAKPPDLPRYERIIVLPNGIEVLDPHALTTLGVLSHYPIQFFPMPETAPPAGAEEASEVPVPQARPLTPSAGGDCPYLPRQRAVTPLVDSGANRSVLDKLKSLEDATALIQQARGLARQGKVEEAVAHLEKARQLVPGSPCEKRAEELLQEIAAEEPQSTTYQSLFAGCGGLSQFGLCWAGQLLGWISETDFELHVEKARNQVALKKGKPASGQITVRFSVRAPGTDANGTAIECNGMPLHVVLDKVLHPYGLEAKLVGGALVVVPKATKPMPTKEDPAACEEPCPKCTQLHQANAGKQEMFEGLMKACRLAVSESRFAKAAELARQAHALYPDRVESDPMVIKLDLLNQYHSWKPKSPTGDAEEQEDDGSAALMPALPGLDPGVVGALDSLLPEVQARRWK